jgi:MYXO-CTERM domain-containing protein
VKETDGTETSCVPYKCVAGACRSSCDTTSDCASGYECKSKTCVKTSDGGAGGSGGGSGGTAGTGGTSGSGAQTGAAGTEPAAPGSAPAAQEGGCGCRVPSPGAQLPWGWIALGCAAVAAARRRRFAPTAEKPSRETSAL